VRPKFNFEIEMTELFQDRHSGIQPHDEAQMLQALGLDSTSSLIAETIPADILLDQLPDLPQPMTEKMFLRHISNLASRNQIFKSYIGQGWYDTNLPPVIQRNILENPSWYTSYTPYQAEISQGRLEALLNFQTAVCEFTGMDIANASLLDEATAAAEAATMMYNIRSRDQEKRGVKKLFVADNLFPQTLEVLKTRTAMQNIEMVTGDFEMFEPSGEYFGMILQYPDNYGNIHDYSELAAKAAAMDIKVAVAADILSLALLTPPGEWGADIVFGSTQRWGIPMNFGGPSAAYFSCREAYKREMPGRIIGVSKDAYGKTAYRMALQTREQHIRREKATSNICTAQALLANMAGMYTVYHGPEGIRRIALRIHSFANYFNEILQVYGYNQLNENFFDTLRIELPEGILSEDIRKAALNSEVNLRYLENGEIGISFDETTDLADLNTLIEIFANTAGNQPAYVSDEEIHYFIAFDEQFERKSAYLKQEVFNLYRSETEMMRYIKRLERKDISLTHSMISLGSCTMKLNAAAELLPLSMPAFNAIHPLVPEDQAEGYYEMIADLESLLCDITGFQACSLQPNSGASGEFAGLITIYGYLKSIGESQRRTVLIPASAHGTNPASAAQAGLSIVVVKCDEQGNVDMADWTEKALQYKDNLLGCMITYPSTHGIFEKNIKKMCAIIHENGGQVYMDGANMNAQVGLTNPAIIGADVCHLNLHKTFAIPHGGGGPGIGPICVAAHLAPFLPGKIPGEPNRVSAAPYGSAGVLSITYGYIMMLGAEGLRKASVHAILNANYLAAKLDGTYGVLYKGENGRVGHELILDCRRFKQQCGITETDIAKRLIDYGFHAPTLSFPVHGTLMVEPTESESLAELDRFAEAMLSIYAEITEIEDGRADKADNVLINAPHPEYEVTADEWNHPYPRSKAAYPANWLKNNKFWINVARVDNAFGDRNLVCTCPPVSDWAN
jgi:glycine dehydrogenase